MLGKIVTRVLERLKPKRHSLRERVFVVGIPHLNWKLVNLMMKKRKLKNLTDLKRGGSWGVIHQQQDICSTPVEFTSMITGVKKERHLIGHGARSDREYVKDGKLYTRTSIRAKTVWELALARGKRVGIYHWLLTWPPKKIRGFMVTGRLSQDENKTYPEKLRARLSKEELEFDFFVPHTAFRLIKEYDVDLFLGMDERTHGPIHVLWEYVEPTNIKDKERIEMGREELFSLYEQIDPFFGMVREDFPDATLIVVGDSGSRLRDYPIYTLGKESFDLFKRLDIGIQLYAYDIYPPYLPKAKPTLHIPGRSEREKRRIAHILSQIRHRDTGEGFIKNITWNGDLLSFAFNFHPSWIGDKCNWLRLTLPDGEDFDIWVTKQTGAALPVGGVFIANGPQIREGKYVGRVDTVDVAPTILRLLDIPIPKNLEGKIPRGMFR